MLLLMACKIVQ